MNSQWKSSLRAFAKGVPQKTHPLPRPFTRSFWPGVLALLGGLACAQAQTPPGGGLTLWLKADAGISTNAAGQVTAWRDQSASGSLAAPRAGAGSDEMPQWAGGVVNGKPVVRFDGVNNVLEIPNSASLQPQSGDWTCVFVGKRLGASQGDYPQIIGSRPWTTGTDKGWAIAYSSSGYLGSHFADGDTGHDAPAVLSASALSQNEFQLWLVEEDRARETTTFYKNGDLNATRHPTMPAGAVDQTESVFIGREIGGSDSRRANMELAEVLVYNRALSKTDRDAVSVYLAGKYGFGFTPNNPPSVSLTAPTNAASYAVPASFTLTASASDGDGVVKKVDFYAGSRLIATASMPPYSAPVSIASTGSVAWTAVATDNRDLMATSAPVNITINGSFPMPALTVKDGLQLWLKADTGVSSDGTGAVSSWEDSSGNGNTAFQDNAMASYPASYQPVLLSSAANGRPAIQFDGIDDFLKIASSSSLRPESGDWTVIFAAQRGSSSQGDYPQIIGSRPWTAGEDMGWSICFNNSNGRIASHYADGVQGHDLQAALATSPFSTDSVEVWQVEENRSQELTSFYLLGKTNSTVKTIMPAAMIDQPNDIYIGSEIEGSDTRRAGMNLSELLIYSRVLSETERKQAGDYLMRKYAVTQISLENAAPSVSLSVAGSESAFTAPAAITLTAEASDADGKIARVDFYNGTVALGSLTNSPYTLKTVITALGSLSLTAVATDNLGASGTSAPVAVKVISPGTQLIGKADYSDSFTINAARQDGLYNINTNGAYNVEDNHGHAASGWTPISAFSFNTPGSSTDPVKLAAAQGNAGSGSGFAQSGGGDFSMAYGLNSNYVVQIDAILPSDRLDISSLPSAGAGIFAANSLSVFLRRDSAANNPGIGLFNGVTETGVTNLAGSYVRTGVNDNNWHSFGVHFDQPNGLLRIYVDGVLLTTVPLSTFANGLYRNFSNAAVGVGGDGGVFWLDNFKVGAPPLLIESPDYEDTFTLNDIRADGLYNDNSGGAYSLETTHASPPADWTPTSSFSFNTPSSSTDANKLGAATGNAGAETGLAQSGGGDVSFAYGLGSNYIVQVDAIIPTDRFDITSLPAAGGGIFATDSLSVFFRRDSYAGTAHPDFPETGLPAMGLYNGKKETAVVDASGGLIFTGINDANWHNLAVQFDQTHNLLKIYVDRILKGTVDLAAFAGGIYMYYSNGAVGAGGNGGVFWMDNFQVGAPAASTAPLGAISISRQQTDIVLTWSGSGTLEQAPSIAGPWTTLPAVASPRTVPASAQQQYYRLRQ